MISRRAFFAAALALLAPLASHAFADDLPDLDGMEVVVAVENTYPPLQFIDPKTGEAIGWEYDAVAEIAKRLNLKVDYVTTSWDAMIQAVHDGQYDMAMNGITIREDRMEMVDFSAAYMHSEMLMLARGDEDRFSDAQSFAAFDDGLIGSQAGTTPFYTAVYEVLDGDEQDPRIKLYETIGAAVQALRIGDVDLVLTDSTAAEGYVDVSNGALKLIGEPLGAEDFGFIFPLDSELEDLVTETIATMKADGTLDALNKKWFVDYKMGQ